jgi:hypothetical protein
VAGVPNNCGAIRYILGIAQRGRLCDITRAIQGGTALARKQWTAAERLLAEQAVALQREVTAARAAAAWGQGWAVTEAAVMQGGREFLRNLREQTLSAQPGAQKGGSAASRARVGKTRVSKGTRRSG